MAKKEDSLEALDFIINVLKDHEKDLDRLITELGNITDKLGDSSGLVEKMQKIEDRLSDLQRELGSTIQVAEEKPDLSSRISKMDRELSAIKISISGLEKMQVN